jgi:hypothetical protein
MLLALPAHGAEVERIEESEIPAKLEKSIELKKESDTRILPIVDITALGTYSSVSGANDIGGADIRGSIAPVFRLDEKNYIIPLYYGSYRRERQVTIEEEGGRVYEELMDHNVTLEYKHAVNEKTVFKVDGLARFHFVKEQDYDWSEGLYDYEDLGVGSSVEYFFTNEPAKKNSVGIGGEFYRREYPNYRSLIALASVTSPETDEKDYFGYRLILRHKYLDRQLQAAFLYSPLYKDFNDKKVIGSDGVLQGNEREDWFHYAKLNVSYLMKGTPFVLGLGLKGIMVDSNQNYYDSRSTVSLADDVFTSNYYSFKSLNVNPYVRYIHKLKDKKKPATVTVGYDYLIRAYDDRKVQQEDSSYSEDDQQDQAHTVNVQATYPLNDHLSLIGVALYTKALSNMKYQTFYRYRYDSVFVGGGVRISY